MFLYIEIRAGCEENKVVASAPGHTYIGWVSVNFHMVDYYANDWEEIDEDILMPHEYYLGILAKRMAEIRQVAPDKPIFFLELGIPDNTKKGSLRAAEKIRLIFHEIIEKDPEIHGFSMWSFHPSWGTPDAPDYFRFDCLVRPGTAQATAFKKVIHRHPNAFHSCVYFSDGGGMPSCAPAISSPVVRITSRPIAA